MMTARTSKMRSLAPGAATACVLLLASPPGARADTIELSNGGKRGGQVTLAKWDSVQYVVGKAPTTLTGDQVASILRDSTFLQAGREALDAGDYTKAAASLGSVGEKAKDWEQAEARYLTGKAFYSAKNYKEAEKVLKAYLDRYKADKDWFIPPGTLLLGDVLLAARQPGTAEIRYKELEQYGPKWTLQGKVGQASAMMAQGEAKAPQARQLLDEVVRNPAAPIWLKQRATVARANAYLLQKQPQQAIEVLNPIFESPKPGELGYTAERAEATLLMGRAHAALGAKNDLEEAEIWLLRAVAIYRKDPEIHADACSSLAEVYTQLGNKARADQWKQKGAGITAASAAASPPASAPAPAAPAKATSSKKKD